MASFEAQTDFAPTWDDMCVPHEDVERFNMLAARSAKDVVLGCVCRLDRGYPCVLTQQGIIRAEHDVAFAKEKQKLPAIGDWVAVDKNTTREKALILEVLPRRNALSRWKGTSRADHQVLAANVDTVVVVQPFRKNGVDIHRIVRSALVGRDCNCDVVVVLSKADRAQNLQAIVRTQQEIHAVLPNIALVISSVQEKRGIEELKALLPPKSVSVMLGESGAGKSSLLNALLGKDVLETHTVRSHDDAGRHTTVTRRMLKIPGCGVVIDCPGLRSLPLLGHVRGLELLFPAIFEASQACKFSDCTHTHEPGCAVLEAYKKQKFSSEALDAYRMIAQELRTSKAKIAPDVKSL